MNKSLQTKSYFEEQYKKYQTLTTSEGRQALANSKVEKLKDGRKTFRMTLDESRKLSQEQER